MSETWDDIFTNHVYHGQESVGESLVEHVPAMPVQSLQDQLHLLSSISNYHWWCSIDKFGHPKSARSEPKYKQHVLFFPEHRKDSPASPRNVLMNLTPYMYSAMLPSPENIQGYRRMIVNNLLYLVHYDQVEGASVLHCRQPTVPPLYNPPPPTNEAVGDGPPVKKRRYASRVISADPIDLLEGNPEGAETLTSSVVHRSQYQLFCEEMHSDGFIQWRKHSVEENVVVMNNFCPYTAKLKPLEYVHVTAFAPESGEVQVKCTCQTYHKMQGKALQKIHSSNFADTVLAQNFTCMHCRFYFQFLQPIQASLYASDCINKLHEKIRQTAGEINSPVVLLGEASPTTVTKLSVAGESTYSFVHIQFSPAGCLAQCQNGLCPNLYKVRKRIPRGISLGDIPREQMCDHLWSLVANRDVLQEAFPEHFESTDLTPEGTDMDTDPADDLEPEVINTEDFGLKGKPGNVSFDVNEGKWICSSHSFYKPSDHRFDSDLVRCVGERREWGTELIPAGSHKGTYKGPDLTCAVTNEEGEVATCCCGEEYTEDTEIQVRDVTVYTRNVSKLESYSNALESYYYTKHRTTRYFATIIIVLICIVHCIVLL